MELSSTHARTFRKVRLLNFFIRNHIKRRIFFLKRQNKTSSSLSTPIKQNQTSTPVNKRKLGVVKERYNNIEDEIDDFTNDDENNNINDDNDDEDENDSIQKKFNNNKVINSLSLYHLTTVI